MADLLDVLTLQEAKRELRIPQATITFDTNELPLAITAASRRMDDIFGPFVTRAFTRTVLAPSGDLFLDVPPGSPTFTVTLSTVTEYTSGTATVLTAEDFDTSGTYRWDPSLGRVLRRASWAGTSWGLQEVILAGTWGRYANTAAVGAEFKRTCGVALRFEWAQLGYGNGVDPLTTGAGIGVAGGDGNPAGFAPYTEKRLREELVRRHPNEALMSALGVMIA